MLRIDTVDFVPCMLRGGFTFSQRGRPVWAAQDPERSPMSTRPQPSRSQLSPEHRQLFLRMLPGITDFARQRFMHLGPDAKQEAVAEVIAAALVMFVHLAHAGRESLAYPTVLAMYGVRRYRSGRKVAGSQGSRDVMSRRCQLARGITVEQLTRPSDDGSSWQEIVVEDKHAGPAEVAATRMDFSPGCSPCRSGNGRSPSCSPLANRPAQRRSGLAYLRHESANCAVN